MNEEETLAKVTNTALTSAQLGLSKSHGLTSASMFDDDGDDEDAAAYVIFLLLSLKGTSAPFPFQCAAGFGGSSHNGSRNISIKLEPAGPGSSPIRSHSAHAPLPRDSHSAPECDLDRVPTLASQAW